MNLRKAHIILHLIVFGNLAMLLVRCVVPFVPELNENELSELMVVEGLISDQPGSMGVSLSCTAPVYPDSRNVVHEFHPITGAEVFIHDDRGNSFLLMENEPGRYEPEDINAHGTPGNSYYLSITTVEGKHHESSLVLMEETPEIDEVFFQEESRTSFDQDIPYEENWLNILLNTRASGENTRYFKWEFEETWEFEMPSYVKVYHGTGPFDDPPSMESIEIELEKKHCWVSERSASILTESTFDKPDNEIRDFVIQSIGPPDDRLNYKYSILVKQYVINRQLYEFFRNVREANEESGGIYEKTPLQIIGNMQCCDGSEPVLGYFMASTVKTKRIFITPSEHEVALGTAFGGCGWTTSIPRSTPVYFYGTYNSGETNVWSTNIYCTDCRVRGTNVKPDYWE